MEEKEKKISELENESLLVARSNSITVDRLTKELEEIKEQVSYAKRNEAIIEVYKSKVEQMGDLRTELTNSQEQNQSLQADIEMLQRDQDKDEMMEDVVRQVQHELGQVKVKLDMKELQLQEVTFGLKDAESRVKELETKEKFYNNQIDKLTSEQATKSEELILMKKEN